MDEALKYCCTNDDCNASRTGRVFEFGSESGEAVCPYCGWMLSAVYEA